MPTGGSEAPANRRRRAGARRHREAITGLGTTLVDLRLAAAVPHLRRPGGAGPRRWDPLHRFRASGPGSARPPSHRLARVADVKGPAVRVARFRVSARLDMASRVSEGTVTIGRSGEALFSVRPLRRRRLYELPLSTVAELVCRHVIVAELREMRAARKKGSAT